MEFPFKAQVAVITGAGSGIGLSLAKRFAREGMKLVLADIDAPALSAAADMLASDGVQVAALATDVSAPDSVEALCELAYERFGGVHVLCNNAGVVPSGRTRHVWEYALEDWRWALDVNLFGVLNGIRSFVPRMIASGEPAHVVNTASMAGLVSGPRSVVYSTSKHAVVRVTEALYGSMQVEGYPIGVTLLCPGLVDTKIYSSERSRPAELVPSDGVAQERPDLVNAAASGLAPDTVADIVVDAISRKQFYALTSSSYDEHIAHRTDAVLQRQNPSFPDVFKVQDYPSRPAHGGGEPE